MHRNLPLQIRRDLYREAMGLARCEGWGYKKVSRLLSDRHKIRVPPSTVHSWLRQRHTPTGSCNILETRPSNELAYIAGAVIGDGTIYRSKHRYNDEVRLAVVDRDFCESFARCLSSLFPLHGPFRISTFSDGGCNRFVARVGSRLLADFLSQPIRGLMELIRPYSASFLRGLFDAEGAVVVSTGNGRRLSLRLELTNSDIEILHLAQEILDDMRIHSRVGPCKRDWPMIRHIRGKPVVFSSKTYWLMISQRRSMQRFADNIGLTIQRKQQKLRDALSLIERFGTETAGFEWLRLYTKEGTRWVRREDILPLGSPLIRNALGPVVQLVKTSPSHWR